jgi:hypothetical protein
LQRWFKAHLRKNMWVKRRLCRCFRPATY